MTDPEPTVETPSAGIDLKQHPLPLGQFQQDYLFARRPVVIRVGDLADIDWRTHRWTAEYLIEKVGPRNVIVQLRRGGIFGAGYSPDAYQRMRFDQFVRSVMDDQAEREDLYLNLQDMDKLMTPPLLQLMGDFGLPVYFRDLPVQWINLWMGRTRQATKSQLHHDFHDNLYCVVEGTKTFTVFPPEDARNLYLAGKVTGVEPNGVIRYETNPSVKRKHFSQVDTELVDTRRFPEFRNARPQRVEVQAGDLFFMPAGWFHEVQSRGRHIAINFWSDPPPNDMVRR